MSIYIPYTYLIGWSKYNYWYYGSEYANNQRKIANPKNLWTIYFTSSKQVQIARTLFGDPDIIQIRKTFKTKSDACLWETKVLRKMKVMFNPTWLNQFDGVISNHNKTSNGKHKKLTEQHKQAISNGRKGIKFSDEHKLNLSKANKGKAKTFVHTEEQRLKISISKRGKPS